MEAHQRGENLAAEEEWHTLQRERAFVEQQNKFNELKEAQQRRKSARLADWAVWEEEGETPLQQQTKEKGEVATADWATWTTSKAAEYDRVRAQERARSFRGWENWVVLHEPPDAPRVRGDAPQRRQVRVEAGISVGDRQPVKKARWHFLLEKGLEHKVGFHFTIQEVPVTDEISPRLERTPAGRPDDPLGLQKGPLGTCPTAALGAEGASEERHAGGERMESLRLPGALPHGSGRRTQRDSASGEAEVRPSGRDNGEGATLAEKENWRGGGGHHGEEERARVLRLEANVADTILLHSQGSQEPENVVDSLESVSSQQGPSS